MSNDGLIKRVRLGSSRDVSIKDFISGCIDYRTVGILRAVQLAELKADFESVAYRSMFNGQRSLVDRAEQVYEFLINHDYMVNAKVDFEIDG